MTFGLGKVVIFTLGKIFLLKFVKIQLILILMLIEFDFDFFLKKKLIELKNENYFLFPKKIKLQSISNFKKKKKLNQNDNFKKIECQLFNFKTCNQFLN